MLRQMVRGALVGGALYLHGQGRRAPQVSGCSVLKYEFGQDVSQRKVTEVVFQSVFTDMMYSLTEVLDFTTTTLATIEPGFQPSDIAREVA